MKAKKKAKKIRLSEVDKKVLTVGVNSRKRAGERRRSENKFFDFL